MKNNRIVQSAKELKNTKSLAMAAMLLAIATVLGIFSIPVGTSLKIGLSTLAIQLTAALFGPVVSGSVGALADILQYLIRPTGPYFPGFTISGAIGGIIFGLIYYKRRLSIPRIAVANLIVTVFVNILLNTFWLKVLYGKGFLALLPGRVTKNLVLLPIYVILFYLMTRALERAGLRKED